MHAPRKIHLLLFVASMLSATRTTGRQFVQAAFQPQLNARRKFLQRSRAILFSSADSTNEPAKGAMAAASDDTLEAYRNPQNRNDQVFSAISANGGIKVTACTVRNLVNDMMIQHTMTEVPTEVRLMLCLPVVVDDLVHRFHQLLVLFDRL